MANRSSVQIRAQDIVDMSRYTEDTLVQQTTADYLREQLGWQSIYAYNNEDFGPNSLLGRAWTARWC